MVCRAVVLGTSVMIKLTMADLAVTATLGVYPHEQREREFMLNIEFEYDAAHAVASDDIAYAIDYELLAHNIRTMISAKKWQLVESLVYEVAKYVVQYDKRISKAVVVIRKPQALQFAQCVSATACYTRACAQIE